MQATSKDFVLAVYEDAWVFYSVDSEEYQVCIDVAGHDIIATGPTSELAWDAAEEFIIDSQGQSREYSSETA